jgi:Rrf2 family protein
MMKVSTKTTYAIKALIHLGRRNANTPIRLSEIAEAQHIPLPYLEQIFSKLRRAGLVVAIRGPQGGYKLTKSPSDTTLAEIVSVLEGPIEPVLCSMPENRSPNCHDVEGCVSRSLCNELDGALHRVLEGNTLGSLCASAETKSKPVRFQIRPKESIQPSWKTMS